MTFPKSYRILSDQNIVLEPGSCYVIKSHISGKYTKNYYGKVVRHFIPVYNGGLVKCDQEHVGVICENNTNAPLYIEEKDHIANFQIIFF
jgi:hypothetical protein